MLWVAWPFWASSGDLEGDWTHVGLRTRFVVGEDAGSGFAGAISWPGARKDCVGCVLGFRRAWRCDCS